MTRLQRERLNRPVSVLAVNALEFLTKPRRFGRVQRSGTPGFEAGVPEPISLLLNHLSGASTVRFLLNHAILG